MSRRKAIIEKHGRKGKEIINKKCPNCGHLKAWNKIEWNYFKCSKCGVKYE